MKEQKPDNTPFQLIKKVMAPLSANQKSHDPPPYSTSTPPVEIVNGPLPDWAKISPFICIPNMGHRFKYLPNFPKGPF